MIKLSKILFYRTLIAIWLGIFLATSGYFVYSAYSAPRLANIYFWQITDSEAIKLAKWDVLVLDMETQINSQAQIKRIKSLNPKIILLAYVPAQEIATNLSNVGVMRKKLAAGIHPSWFLTKENGNKISFWPGTNMLNPTDLCPKINGQKWNNYLANFVNKEILSTGLWDGVFYDNTWGGMTWFTGSDVDLNYDGVKNDDLDGHWRAGMRELFSDTKRLSNNRYLIVGNANTREYRSEWNGTLIESFSQQDWADAMNTYRFQTAENYGQRIVMVNNNTNNRGGQNNYQQMRYGLASALQGDGYYSFDYGNSNHAQTWWYDEYDVQLGDPTSNTRSLSGLASFGSDIWRRDYVNGVALVNSSNQEKTVDLGGEFEKVIGTQDPVINNGSIVSKITIAPKDGIILRKTFQQIDNTIFINGSFVKFFNFQGKRTRNGFFVFEDGAAGGARIFKGDLNSDGFVDKVVSTDQRLEVFNNLGNHWFDDYPFSSQAVKYVNFSLGKEIVGGGRKMVVSPYVGNEIKIYTYFGALEKEGIFPLGKKYKGGFCAVLGKFDGKNEQLVVGTGRGVAGEILLYDLEFSKIKTRFYPYGKSFTNGLAVAAGDVFGDDKDEIVTAARVNNKISVKIFDYKGKKISEFSAGELFGNQLVYVGLVKIDNSGQSEIMIGTN